MVFSSGEFLFAYLPLSLIIYFTAPVSWRNAALFAVSLAFYGWEKPLYLPIMLFVVVINYVFGYLIDRAGDDARKRKRRLILGLILNIAALCFFKYTDFLLENLSLIPFLSFINPIGISLPVGISFYTFQSMSYITDVYRRTSTAQKKFVNFGAYVSMFPQLVAGPIVRYSDVDRELNERTYSVSNASDGAHRFIVGLSKKALLADPAGEAWEQILNVPESESSVFALWLGIIFYTFQIYFDFSGYSDMAIGLGKILGFQFPENFNYPYISKSITEFWRRWHITLSSWFKEYVYIPLGGNRKGKARLILNLLAVWLLTGLWHGASWNFVLWGFYYFVLLTFEKLFLSKRLEKIPSIFSRAYALFFVAVGWLIFYFKADVGGLAALCSYFGGLLGISGLPLLNRELLYLLTRNLLFLAILCIASTPYPRELLLKIKSKIASENKRIALTVALNLASALMFVLCIAYIFSSDYRPNIYFEF